MRRRGHSARRKILAPMMFVVLASSGAQGGPVDLNGDWRLFHKGNEIEVGRWRFTDKYGNKITGEEIRGPYRVQHDASGIIYIYHDKTVWLLGFPRGDSFDTRRTAEGYSLGPDFGNADLLELRVRPGGNELEIWRDTDRYDAVLDLVFTDYTLVRAKYTQTFSGAPDFPL